MNDKNTCFIFKNFYFFSPYSKKKSKYFAMIPRVVGKSLSVKTTRNCIYNSIQAASCS